MTFSSICILRIALFIFLTTMISGCTVKATLKSTSDAISNVLSSTTGRSWFTEDGLVRKGEEALAFASMNFENLQGDMAQGGGEYLTSFAELLSIKTARLDEFTSMVQSRYAKLITSPKTTPETFMGNLFEELARPPSLNSRKMTL